MTKVFFLLTAVTFAGTAYFGLRQASSVVLRQELPRTYWPRGNGILLRTWVPGYGYRMHVGRSDWDNFRGGGPGSGK